MRQLKAEYYKMKYSRASKWVLVFMAFIFFIPFVVGNDTLFMTFGDYRNIDSYLSFFRLRIYKIPNPAAKRSAAPASKR